MTLSMTGVKERIGILQFKDFYQRQTNNSRFYQGGITKYRNQNLLRECKTNKQTLSQVYV